MTDLTIAGLLIANLQACSVAIYWSKNGHLKLIIFKNRIRNLYFSLLSKVIVIIVNQ